MTINTDKKAIDIILRLEEDGGRIMHFFPNREMVLKRFALEEQLHFYFGIDPTGPSLHLGHTVPLFLLKHISELGHKITLLIGDFTARIGDPMDKAAARTTLSSEEIEQNMLTYVDQVHKILKEDSFDIVYNRTWLESLNLERVLDLSSRVTVQQLLERDMFQERIKNKKPIYLHEFFYPLMQGYDSVALEVDGEIGGNDQIFNMLIGRDLEKEYLKKDKIVLATRLLVNADSGKKMSKSEGGLIALDEIPREMFGKVMAFIPDEMIKTVFELCTEVCDTENGRQKIKAWQKKSDENSTDYRDFKLALAHEITRIYHGDIAADQSQKEFTEKEIPKDIKSYSPTSDNESLADVLNNSGVIVSKSEVRRLVEQKGISINGEKIDNPNIAIKKGDIIQIGSHRFLKIDES